MRLLVRALLRRAMRRVMPRLRRPVIERAMLAVMLLCGAGLAPAAAQEAPTHERGDLTVWESLPSDPGVPTLESLLGFRIGEHFVRHNQVVDALQAIADSTDRVELRQYGESHQRRPLTTAVISSPENLENLEQILADNRDLADPETPRSEVRRIVRDNPAVAWLSFGVHGNEASTAEAALLTIHRLASAQGRAADELLENLVVAIDPALNPDGRQRYVSWYENQYGVGAGPNPDPQSMEHWEPWPGGRTNHYMFDLNRDWIWMVQPESAARIPAYREFMPQLHIDNHEQGYTSPYFFGLGDEPYNTNISMRTRGWVGYYGDVYSEVFDREGKLYSTKERFDYLYPGYGKVLPVYQGAVSMLNEQGGHSRAGLAIEVDENYTLTLFERARNHFLINISALEVTAKNREEQLRRFRSYFLESIELAQDNPWACVVSADNDPQLLARLWRFCEMQGIRVDRLTRPLGRGLYAYDTGDRARGEGVPAGSWVISAEQPLGRLVKAAFERSPEITDKDTYDVTSWSLPVAYGLDAYYTTDEIDTRPLASWSAPAGELSGDGGVALLVDADQHLFPLAVNAAAERGLSARFAGDEIEIDGRTFAMGSLIVHTRRNLHADLDEYTDEVLAAGIDVHATGKGITESGPVLGANANDDLEMPMIGLVGGSPVSSYSYGQHWHMIDLAYPLPYSSLPAEDLSRLDLGEYNVLAMPSSGALDGGDAEAVRDYVRGGGVLVATGSAAYWAQSRIVGIDDEPDEGDGGDRPAPSELTYDERGRRSVEDRVPGSLFNVQIDTGHPLAAGAGQWVGVIKRDARTLRARDFDQVIARYADDPLIGGVASERNRDRIAGEPFMTAHRVGGGWVICLADDTTFRGFTHGSMRLLLNALMYSPSL